MSYEAVASASALERVIACPASAVLPGVHSVSGEYAERGTAIHAFIRAVLSGVDPAVALAAVPDEWRATCSQIDFSRLCGGLSDIRCEVAYAIDVERVMCRELGVNIGRNYGQFDILETEVPGSVDIEGRTRSGVPVAIDVKTGHSRVAPCEENPQIMFFALGLMLLTGANEVEGRIAYVSEDGEVFVDRHVFTRFELETFADTLDATILRRVPRAKRIYLAEGTASVATGEHCRYCRSMTYCPAYTSLARTMATDMEQVAAKVEELTDEQAGVAWVKVKAVLALAESVEAALKSRAKQAGFPTPDGKMIEAVPTKGRAHFSGAAAVEMLRARGATDAEIASLYRVSAPGEQIRAVKPKGQLAAKNRRNAA